jgi:hypothetical protein
MSWLVLPEDNLSPQRVGVNSPYWVLASAPELTGSPVVWEVHEAIRSNRHATGARPHNATNDRDVIARPNS